MTSKKKPKKPEMTVKKMEALVIRYHTWFRDHYFEMRGDLRISHNTSQRLFAAENDMTTRQFGDILRYLGDERVQALKLSARPTPEPETLSSKAAFYVCVFSVPVLVILYLVYAFVIYEATPVEIDNYDDCVEAMHDADDGSPISDRIYCNDRFGD